jgi:hypothetical protein
MAYTVDYWDAETKTQKQRAATAAETAEIDALKAAAPPQTPQSVPMRNARLALYSAGRLKQVEDYIAAMDGVDGDLARIDWATALTVRRDSPLVGKLMALLDLTSAQIDALFISAAALA